MTPNHDKMLQAYIDHQRTARNLDLTGASLQGICLAGLRADGVNLVDADLRGSSLAGVKWKGCVLRDARLDAADFTDAVLRLCDLDQARLADATLVRARLENSSARGARFDGADLTGAMLTDTDFARASFRGANLKDVEASGANFRGADLRGAQLQNAQFVDADLRGADLSGAILHGTNLQGADLRGIVSDDPVLQQAESQRGDLPPAMSELAETMAPIVTEVLRSAGERGVIDADTTARLIEDAARQPGASPSNAPNPATLQAVLRVMDKLGANMLPALLGSLQQPNQGEPSPEVQTLILQLREELGLGEAATAEDVLLRLTGGTGRGGNMP